MKYLTFFEALNDSEKENSKYDINKWIYVPNRYLSYRYLLGTKGNNPLICIGINPSTAEPDNLDNTLKSVERISKNNGFDSFIMINVYPERATNPDDMSSQLISNIHKQNLLAFSYVLSKYEKCTIWAGWGTIVLKRSYLSKCLKEMYNISLAHDATWVHFGKISKAGHPHHPLYLRKDSIALPFDMDNYIKNIIK